MPGLAALLVRSQFRPAAIVAGFAAGSVFITTGRNRPQKMHRRSSWRMASVLEISRRFREEVVQPLLGCRHGLLVERIASA